MQFCQISGALQEGMARISLEHAKWSVWTSVAAFKQPHLLPFPAFQPNQMWMSSQNSEQKIHPSVFLPDLELCLIRMSSSQVKIHTQETQPLSSVTSGLWIKRWVLKNITRIKNAVHWTIKSDTEQCSVSLLIVRLQWSSWIRGLNCLKCQQFRTFFS